MHRFDHKLEIISKSQLTIKAQNLKATLPAIIFIRNVFHLSLQEWDHQEEAGVWEHYKTYKNAAIYKNEMRLEFEFKLAKFDPFKLRHMSANSSVLQATAACGMHRWGLFIYA